MALRVSVDKGDESWETTGGLLMKLRLCHATLTMCLLFALVCSFERPAYAYIDPGSGLYACQAIGAFFAGALYYFRLRVKRLFNRSAGERAKGSL